MKEKIVRFWDWTEFLCIIQATRAYTLKATFPMTQLIPWCHGARWSVLYFTNSLKYAKAPEDDTAPPQKLQDTARVPVPRLHLAMHAFQLQLTCYHLNCIRTGCKPDSNTLKHWWISAGFLRKEAFLRLTISEAEIFEHASLEAFFTHFFLDDHRGSLDAKLHEDLQKDAVSPPPFAPRLTVSVDWLHTLWCPSHFWLLWCLVITTSGFTEKHRADASCKQTAW